MRTEDLMVMNMANGTDSQILGKFLYYSFPKLIIDRQKFIELAASMNFPVSIRETHSKIDAFKCATTDVKDRIVDKVAGEFHISRHYFVPKQYMYGIDELEDFLEELNRHNGYKPKAETRARTYERL